MSEQLYRLLIEGDVNFDHYMEEARSDAENMSHGTIVQRDVYGRPIGFFVRVSPYWGMMYDGDTLYRRGSFGGTGDQFVGQILGKRLFVPVKRADFVVVEEITNGAFESAEMNGFTTLDPGRYSIVKHGSRWGSPPGVTS